jgi:hypothetical protein
MLCFGWAHTQARTVLLKEVEGLSSLPAPFAVPNPFYIRVISASVKPGAAPSPTAAAAGEAKAKAASASASAPSAAADSKSKAAVKDVSLPFVFAPLTVTSFEALHVVAEVLLYTRQRLRLLRVHSAALDAALRTVCQFFLCILFILVNYILLICDVFLLCLQYAHL